MKLTPEELERNVNILAKLEDYILDLRDSDSAYDKSRAQMLFNGLHNLSFETKESMVKFIGQGWDYISIEYKRHLLAEADVVMYKGEPFNLRGAIIGPSGRVLRVFDSKNVKMQPSEPVPAGSTPTYMDNANNWKKVDMSADDFLSLDKSISKIDKKDGDAILSL